MKKKKYSLLGSWLCQLNYCPTKCKDKDKNDMDKVNSFACTLVYSSVDEKNPDESSIVDPTIDCEQKEWEIKRKRQRNSHTHTQRERERERRTRVPMYKLNP